MRMEEDITVIFMAHIGTKPIHIFYVILSASTIEIVGAPMMSLLAITSTFSIISSPSRWMGSYSSLPLGATRSGCSI